nr:MAG TPA: portal protein [Caudoviricetes sp.]
MIDAPEVAAAIWRIADMIGSMTIHLMQNTDKGDVRVRNALARKVDIDPFSLTTRQTWINWIVQQMLLEGNAFVLPTTSGGILTDLVPMPQAIAQLRPDGNPYDIVYTGDLIYGEDATASLSGTLHPDGHVPAAISVTFYGGAASPVISLTGQLTGKLYGACRISDTIASGETLLFSTDYLDSYVRKLSASGAATDLLSKIDLDGEPFFRLPLTEPCTLTIAAQAAISGAADVEVFYYYRSV